MVNLENEIEKVRMVLGSENLTLNHSSGYSVDTFAIMYMIDQLKAAKDVAEGELARINQGNGPESPGGIHLVEDEDPES